MSAAVWSEPPTPAHGELGQVTIPTDQLPGRPADPARLPPMREHHMTLRIYAVRRDGSRYNIPSKTEADTPTCNVEGCTCDESGSD